MIETIEEVIPAALDGQRIDRVVALLGDVSRSEAARCIADGDVTVDGVVPGKVSDRVQEHQLVTIVVERISNELVADPSVSVPVVHEDEHVLVVDKPAGLVVHPGAGTLTGTMVHGLIARYPDLVGVGPPERPGIVHRLDKGTSGLLMVARTTESLEALSRQLAARTVERRYQTLVWNRVNSSEGLIDAPLGRSPRDPTRHAVVVGGREARTRYEVMQRFEEPELTLLACRLETGRTHQIRVHLEAIGHPVVGDDRYGASDETLGLDRPFLHAEALGFEHPGSGEWLSFASPLPADLTALIDDLSGGPSSDVDDVLPESPGP